MMNKATQATKCVSKLMYDLLKILPEKLDTLFWNPRLTFGEPKVERLEDGSVRITIYPRALSVPELRQMDKERLNGSQG